MCTVAAAPGAARRLSLAPYVTGMEPTDGASSCWKDASVGYAPTELG